MTNEIVDIILLSYNYKEYTMMAIESLLSNTDYPFRLICVDNASIDGTKEYLLDLKKKHPSIELVLKEEVDGGYSSGVNSGLELSKSKYLCLASNDLIFHKADWLRQMVQTMESDPKIGIVGVKLLYPNGTIQHGGASFDQNNEWFHLGRNAPREERTVIEELPGVTSALCLVRREALPNRKWNDWPQGMWNDVHECCLLRKNGWKIFYNGFVEVYHFESRTQDREYYSKWGAQMNLNHDRFKKEWNEWLKKDKEKNGELYK